MAFTPWTGRPSPAVIARGETREHAEQSADASYVRHVEAPPCPACGRPVRDADWMRHRYEAHGLAERILPAGAADSRELVVVGETPEDLARKVARWRWQHSGLRLSLMADGRVDGGLLFLRYRVTNLSGRPVQ